MRNYFQNKQVSFDNFSFLAEILEEKSNRAKEKPSIENKGRNDNGKAAHQDKFCKIPLKSSKRVQVSFAIALGINFSIGLYNRGKRRGLGNFQK